MKHLQIFSTTSEQNNCSEYPLVSILTDGSGLKYHKKIYKFSNLQIASGPLYYNGTSFEIKDSWNYDSYNTVYGKSSGSYYFNFLQMGELFEKSGFSTSDGNIINELDPIGGWRLPTQTEWASIIGTTRAGSTVNGAGNKHYALIKLTSVTYAGSSTPNGLLIFPDGETITGKTLSGVDNTTLTTSITLAELNVYLEQGCVFLPASGYYDSADDSWQYGGYQGNYLSSTETNGYYAYDLFFTDVSINLSNYDYKGIYFTVRCVRE